MPLATATTVAASTALASRVRAEYREMPGLSLTVSQAARLWAMPQDACEALLHALVEAGDLHRTDDGRYTAPGTLRRARQR